MGSEVRFWRLRGLGGLHLMRARFVGHAFAPHGHETFALGVVEGGLEEIRFRDGVERAGPGAVVFINPEVVHTGAALPGGFRYRVLYPGAEVMAEIAGGRGTPYFPERIIYDPRAARLIAWAHTAVEAEDALTAESRLREALRWLLRTHSTAPAAASAVRVRGSGQSGKRGRFVAAARDLLHARLIDPPGLDELAAAVGTRPSTLLRSFRETYGLPPHAYLVQLRVRTARRLLEAGLPPADAAAATGFFDQAHLTRHFHRIVGVSPGIYQRGGDFVQA